MKNWTFVLVLILTTITFLMPGCSSQPDQKDETKIETKTDGINETVEHMTGQKTIEQGSNLVDQAQKSADKHNKQMEDALKDLDQQQGKDKNDDQ